MVDYATTLGSATEDRRRTRDVRGKIIERLRQGPATITELVDHVYGDDPTGGPLTADKVIEVTIHEMRKRGILIGFKRQYSLDS